MSRKRAAFIYSRRSRLSPSGNTKPNLARFPNRKRRRKSKIGQPLETDRFRELPHWSKLGFSREQKLLKGRHRPPFSTCRPLLLPQWCSNFAPVVRGAASKSSRYTHHANTVAFGYPIRGATCGEGIRIELTSSGLLSDDLPVSPALAITLFISIRRPCYSVSPVVSDSRRRNMSKFSRSFSTVAPEHRSCNKLHPHPAAQPNNRLCREHFLLR